MRKRKSIYDDYTDEELQEIIDESSSYREILEKIGLSSKSGNFQVLKRKIDERNLSTDKLDKNRKIKAIENGKNIQKKNEKTLDEILVENSTYTNNCSLKRKLIKKGLLKNECAICKINNWLGNPITLELDHKNGNKQDNRIENLRLLCPNCHSQTNTFCGKNKVY